MKLLVDEMYPPALAHQLRRRHRDVVAVSERKEWRSLSDGLIFGLAQEERRAIVTENIADFVALADAAELHGRDHYGLVLVDPAKFPRGRQRTVGALVKALDELLGEYSDDKPSSLRHWL